MRYLTILLILLTFGCKKEVINTYAVKYELLGTGDPFQITYLNESGATITESGLHNGWKKEIYLKSKENAYIKAKNAGGGYVTINIYVDRSITNTETCNTPFCTVEESVVLE